MRLPTLPYKGSYNQSMQTTFGGYNHTIGAKDGEIYDMTNLSSNDYPVLTTRKNRTEVTTSGTPHGMYSHGRLYDVRGSVLYKDGSAITGITLTDTDKQFTCIGSFVCVWPDKKWTREISTGKITVTVSGAAATTSDVDFTEFFSAGDAVLLEGTSNAARTVSTVTSTVLTFTEDIPDIGTSIAFSKDICGSMEETTGAITATFKDGTYAEEAAEANTIECTTSGFDFTAHFSVGDAVTISGSAESANNNTFIIREISATQLRFYENTFVIPATPTETITIDRTVPDLDFVLVNENRIWGVSNKSENKIYNKTTKAWETVYSTCIYASKLGDPFNWNVYDGVGTDAFAVQVASAGDFTGAISYLGYPVFFKDDQIYKVYGDKPSNFQVIASANMGVAKGSHKSLAIAGETLYYLSRAGVVAYTGGVPAALYEVFGGQKYKNAVAGSDGRKYYISMYDCSAWHLFVYDTLYGLWMREDETQAADICFHNGSLYIQTATKRYTVDGGGTETKAFSVEFAEETYNSPNKKRVARIILRMEVNSMAWVYIRYDGGQYETVKAIASLGEWQNMVIPIVPKRCSKFQIKIAGSSDIKIYSMTREVATGSQY